MENRHTMVHKLLRAGASPHSLSFGTFWRASGSSVCSSCDVRITPLHMAAYMGNLQVTYQLLRLQNLDNNCKPGTDSCSDKNSESNHEDTNNCENDNQSTNAISSNDGERNKSCDSYCDNDDGNNNNDCQYFANMTPLWLALLQGHVRIVKLFLSFERPLSVISHFGSGLQVCLQEGHKALALMLLRAGYDLNDDLEWIEDGDYPCSDGEIIAHIEALVDQPRSLLDLSASTLRLKFGLKLDDYLTNTGAPKKVRDILNFNDLSKASWQDCLIQRL